MNTESSYIYDQSNEPQGLGRMPTRPAMLLPIPDEPVSIIRNQPIRPRIRPRPTPKPRPAGIPRPVIDKNPVRPPKLMVNTAKKASKPKPRKATKSSKTKAPQKTTKNGPLKDSKDILSGTLNIGGLEIKKTHAVAGGATISGLLLWKLLF